MLYEDTTTDESTYMHLIHEGFPADKSIASVLAYGKAVLTALYDTEIKKRIEMNVYKTAKVNSHNRIYISLEASTAIIATSPTLLLLLSLPLPL